MDLNIRGRRALITGASKGIGLAIAKTLAAEGVDVAIVARNGEALEREARALQDAHGVRAVPIAADLSKLDELQAAVATAVAELGGIDILVNNAGAIPAGSLGAVEDAEVHEAWELKLHGYMRMARALLPGMREQSWGRIINITGMAGIQPSAGYIFGGPANAALMNFTKGLALEAAKDGVLVNSVNPGPIQTERYNEMAATRAGEAGISTDEQIARQATGIPLGRVGRPEEVADVTAFLCSERCTFVAGAVVPVAGGVGSVL